VTDPQSPGLEAYLLPLLWSSCIEGIAAFLADSLVEECHTAAVAAVIRATTAKAGMIRCFMESLLFDSNLT